MTGRRREAHRAIRWLWTSRRADARAARAALLPLALLWRSAAAVRNLAYDRGWRPVRRLPLPAVAVGNLTVGGSGKTPIASWLAGWFAARGLVPGVLLRGYGRDEILLHRQAVPGARVEADPDRLAAAERVAAAGARVLVLDDAFQRRDVARDLDILLVSADAAHAVRWPLPAGPWREPLSAARRAGALVVTRKRADAATAARLADELAPLVSGPVAVVWLAASGYEGLLSGRRYAPSDLAGKRVLAASAIADPEGFIAQTKAAGALVQPASWPDHHDFTNEEVAWLARSTPKVDFVVVTAKDAVKFRDRWPASIPEPLVATLEPRWERGLSELEARLDALLPSGRSR
jgi:tetraacyldisaccharide 4'-kinase